MIQGRISQIFPNFRHHLLSRCTLWLTHESKLPRHDLNDFDEIRHELKPCDVILVEGRSRVARIIQRLTCSRWSHAMLYIGRLEDIEDEALNTMIRKYFDRAFGSDRNPQLIIESELGLGTVSRPLNIYRGEHLRICRPQGLAQTDRNNVLKYAASRLGQEYDVRQIIDLCRLLFPTRLFPRRWRSTLFRNPEPWSRTTCATLIAEAFSFVNFPVRPLVVKDQDSQRLYQRNPKHCTPGDFDYSPWFQVIKFPSPQTGTQGFYKRLPWQKGKLQKDNIDHSHLDELAIQSLKQIRQGEQQPGRQTVE